MKCLNPNCENEDKHRGLCANCYSQASSLVRNGKVTWDQLIRAGKCKEPHKGSRHTHEWLLNNNNAQPKG